MINAVDFFCGAGGFTYGMKQAGINVLFGVDNNPDVRYAYEYNNDVMFACCDIAKVDLGTLPRPLLFVGCAPCQAFSKLTEWRKNIKQDVRRKLLNAFLQQIIKHMPDFVLCENVPPAKNSPEYKEFAEALHKAGYVLTIDVVSAYDYGAPQKRRRLVLAASLRGRIDIHNYSDKRYIVRDAIGHLPPLRPGEQCRMDDHHKCCALTDKVLARVRCVPPGGDIKDIPDVVRGGYRGRFNGTYGRLEWDKPAITITSGSLLPSRGGCIHPEQDRCLSLREMALLQGFPEYYRFDNVVRNYKIAQMIGNAVPPPMARKLAEAVLKYI